MRGWGRAGRAVLTRSGRKQAKVTRRKSGFGIPGSEERLLSVGEDRGVGGWG